MINFERQPNFRSRLFLSLAGFGATGLLLAVYTLGINSLSVSGYGDWGVPGHEMVLWLNLLGFLVMVACLFGLFFRRSRGMSVVILAGCGLQVVLILLSLKTADGIRHRGFERLTREATPLVAAIHGFTKVNGHPPGTLDEVQISYPLDHVIQGDELPKFFYLSGDQAMKRYHGNPWVLMLRTPTGPLRWDMFVYYPLQNYPSLGHGGWFEPIGEWAYVHE